MKSPYILLFGLCSLTKAAVVPLGEPLGHFYQPGGPFDSRSPCPGLNALANHGYLPRDGKNIDLEAIQRATGDAYSYRDDVFIVAVEAVMKNNLSSTGNPLTFNLRDLARHDVIEFDGSLTRNDIFLGDDLHFDPVVWEPVKKDLGLDHIGLAHKDKYVTVESAAKARAARTEAAMAANSDFNPDDIDKIAGTVGLWMTTLWDYGAKAAPKAWVKPFFEEERIAFREGFRPPHQIRTNDSIDEMTKAIRAVKV